ncbi:MAG: transglutaminase domain-containing protein [Spirochaetales bacterium]
MGIGFRIKYYFFKYPLFRALILIGSCVAVFLFFIFSKTAYSPVIATINPTIGQSGDIMTITGEHFGEKNSSSHVEINGMRLTSSSYLTWTDTVIKAVLPYNVSDGLVYVETPSGRSDPGIFANKQTIPVPVQHNPIITVPQIQNITSSKYTVGSIITLNGQNFGNIRGDSEVLFDDAGFDNANNREFITCSQFNKDYQFWSDTQIQIRIPEGSTTGKVYVQTADGRSEGHNITISHTAGQKTYVDSRNYIVQVSADVAEIKAEEYATVTLFMPMPAQSIQQRSMQLLSSEIPAQMTYQNTFVHQISAQEAIRNKISLSHSVSIDVYGVQTNVNVNSVPQYSNTVLALYNEYLQADDLIPSDDEIVTETVGEIVGNERNPWRKAQALYNWTVENIQVLPTLNTADSSVLDALENLQGDAYDMAVLYTAFLRAANIPAIVTAGILVDTDVKTVNHWWCEFYIEDIGWIPADPALGANLPYKAFTNRENPAEFYFGNIDAQHIAFSRGQTKINQTHIMGKKVYRPKSYALQSIWEESTSGVIGYSSYWPDARIIGIY